MLVRELIELLLKENQDVEVFLAVPGGICTPGYHTSNLKVHTGFILTNSEQKHEFYSKHAGNGMFVKTRQAERVMSDGKRFVKTDASTVSPGIVFETFRK